MAQSATPALNAGLNGSVEGGVELEGAQLPTPPGECLMTTTPVAPLPPPSQRGWGQGHWCGGCEWSGGVGSCEGEEESWWWWSGERSW